MRKGDKPKPKSDFTAKHRYVNERELSKIISKSVAGLQLDRFKGQGLPYIKFPRGRRGKVLYDMNKVEEYLDSKTITPKD